MTIKSGICYTIFLEEMGWVEIYEYDLGFCNLHILIEVHPNENDFDDRYRMVAHWINWGKKKKKPSIEVLTFKGTIHMLKYLNLFTRFKIYCQRIGQRGGDIKQLVPKYLVI